MIGWVLPPTSSSSSSSHVVGLSHSGSYNLACGGQDRSRLDIVVHIGFCSGSLAPRSWVLGPSSVLECAGETSRRGTSSSRLLEWHCYQ